MKSRTLIRCLLALAFRSVVEADDAARRFADGVFSWKASGPLVDVGAGRDAADPHVAFKDPTIVFHEGR